jgi:hypothetical protein
MSAAGQAAWSGSTGLCVREHKRAIPSVEFEKTTERTDRAFHFGATTSTKFPGAFNPVGGWLTAGNRS